MVGVNSFGTRVGVDRPPPLLQGTDPEIRGLVARFLVSTGLKPRRVGRIIGVSRSQVYEDLKLADRRLAEAAADDEAA
jgi:hypothetical protein